MSFFLVQALLLCNVFMRAFTNEWRLLPKIFNVLDVAIVAALLVMAMVAGRSDPSPVARRVFRLFLAFNGVIFLGAICNWKWIQVQPAAAQWVMWNLPILLFLALWRLPLPETAFDKFATLLKKLIVIQTLIGVAQVPKYWRTGETEDIIGTFYGNATQYQGFIMMGLCFLIGMRAETRGSKIAQRLAILGILGMLFTIDNKASWVGLGASLFVVYALTREHHGSVFHHAKTIVICAVVGLVSIQIIRAVSPTLNKMSNLSSAIAAGELKNIGKVKAIRDIFSSWQLYPRMAFIGSGPATFYSRSGRQFYAWSEHIYQVGSGYGQRVNASNAMDGVIALSSKPAFYLQFYDTESNNILRIGSGQTDEPFSSYAGLLGETGLIGTLLYMGIYLVIGRFLVRAYREHRHNEKYRIFIACTFGFLTYTLVNCIYNSWLETTRMTTILWSMILLCLRFQPDKSVTPETGAIEDRASDDTARLEPAGAPWERHVFGTIPPRSS